MMKKDLKSASLPLPELTLVGTFSRALMVKPWLLALYKMQLPHSKMHLLLYDNTDSTAVRSAFAPDLPVLKKIFLSVRYYKSGRQGGRTILGQDNNNWKTSKLSPIWQMWLDLRKMIKTDIFFLIEDDTIAPPHAFTALMRDFLSLPNCAFVTGIETGRQLFTWQPVRLGVHSLVRKGNKIIKRISLDPELTGVHEIDCSGVYCFIADTKIYKRAFAGMQKYVKEIPFFGMDNILTNNIKKQGYKLYADFSVWCDHLQAEAGKLTAFNKKQARPFADVWMPEFNNYCQGVEIKKKGSVGALPKKKN